MWPRVVSHDENKIKKNLKVKCGTYARNSGLVNKMCYMLILDSLFISLSRITFSQSDPNNIIRIIGQESDYDCNMCPMPGTNARGPISGGPMSITGLCKKNKDSWPPFAIYRLVAGINISPSITLHVHGVISTLDICHFSCSTFDSDFLRRHIS